MSMKITWSAMRTCLLVAVLVLLAGCSSEPTRLPTASPQPSPEPADTSSANIVPTPEVFLSVLPTPDPNWATLVGTAHGLSSGNPVASTIVFLEQVPDEQTIPNVLYGPPNDQPQSVTDADGNFTIAGISDGYYVIVVFSPPLEPTLAEDPATSQPIIVAAQAGEVIQAGLVLIADY